MGAANLGDDATHIALRSLNRHSSSYGHPQTTRTVPTSLRYNGTNLIPQYFNIPSHANVQNGNQSEVHNRTGMDNANQFSLQSQKN
jgi:hypothetical protein